MKSKNIFVLLMIFAILIGLSTNAFAQSVQDVDNLINEGNTLYEKNNYKGALEKYEEALRILKKNNDEANIGIILGKIGKIYNSLGEYKKALNYHNKALEIARKIGDIQNEGKHLGNIGVSYDFSGDYSKALEYYNKALESARKLGNTKMEGISLEYIAGVYNSLGDNAKSLECFNKVLEIDRKIGDNKNEGKHLGKIGLIYRNLSDYPKALEYFNKALEAFRKIGDVKSESGALGIIGLIYIELSDYPKALEYFNKALEISKKIGDSKNESNNLDSIGLVYTELKDYPKALEYFNKALEISRKIGDINSEGNYLGSIGNVYKSLGDYPKALEYFNKALEISRKIGDINSESNYLGSIGIVYNELGDYPKALEYFNKALEIDRKIGDINSEGGHLGNIGLVYADLGDYLKALEYYNKALEIDRKTGNVEGECTSFENISTVYAEIGDYPKALEYYNKALEINKKIGDINSEGRQLGNIGNVYFDLGDYPKALEYFNKSLEIAEKVRDVKGEGINFGNIGNVYVDLGDYPKALEHYNKALEINRKIGDVDGECCWLGNIGVIYHNLGDYPKALEHYNKSLETSRKIGDVKSEGINLGNIGIIYAEIGDYPKALEYYNKALEINKKIGVPYNGIEGNIGDVYLSQGKFKEAYEIFNRLNHNIRLGRYYLIIKDYGKAKEQFIKYLAKDEKQKTAEILLADYIGLGLSEEGLKNYKEAEKYYKKAVDFIEYQRDSLPENQRKNFFQAKIWWFNRLAPYEGLARIYNYLNRNDEGFLYAENTKARLLSEEIARKYEGTDCIIPLELTNKEKYLSNNITSIYKQIDSAYKKNNQERITELETKLKLLKLEKNAFITNLRQNYPEYASIMYPKPLKSEEIKLNPDEVLIEYEVTYKETLAWSIKNGQIIKTITIPINREELSKLVKEYRGSFEAISNPSDLASIKLDTGKKLYNLLLKDLVTDIKTEHIIIIPDEILGILPFETLITEIPANIKMTQGKYGTYPEGVKYAGDLFTINYYQSASALTMLRTLNKTRENKGIFAVGDPVFSSSDERLTGQAQNKPQELTDFTIALQSAVTKDGFIKFIRLPMTGELVQGLNSLFPEEIQSFTGLDASEKNIKSKNLQDYRYLVFATHGILDNDVPYIQEPALALCQVNNDDEDGFLTMNEVMSMKFSADVAVLSACKTGLGRNVSGEGVVGMGRAFQYAGAKSVIMSLWSVESKSTNIMIEKYFEYLKQGKSNTEALREAKAYIRKEGFEHPFFWGPFIVVGE